MLLNSNDNDLSEKNIASKYHFFYQVWKELTDKRTIDSYQYRIMNTLSILRELNEVIGMRLNGIHSTNHNIDECRTEAMNLIRADTVLEKHYRAFQLTLLKHLSKKAESPSQLRALHHQIEYCYKRIIPHYMEHLFSELELGIDAASQEEIARKANTLISCCASMGWSTPALYWAVDSLFDSESDPDGWNFFKSKLLNFTTGSYCVYVLFELSLSSSDKAKTVFEQLSDFGITVVTGEQAMAEESAIAGLKVPLRKKLMRVQCNAFDQYSACYQAIDSCSNALNMLSFFNYIEPWDLDDVVCWVLDREHSGARKLPFEALFHHHDAIFTGSKFFNSSKTILLRRSSPVARKLNATYAYSSMAKAAGSQEERFMNSWVALESLCRGDAYDNIISNVLETVPPALCSRYVYGLFRNFIEDCYRCGVDIDSLDGAYSFDKKSPWDDRVREMISITKDDCLYAELLDKCKVNSLLAYRCIEMRRLSTENEYFIQRVERHYTTTRMQLSRLYRIRNSIAHTGSTSIDSLTIFTDHLNGYLASFVSEVVITAFSMQEESAEVVFETIKDNYSLFIDIANQKKYVNASDLLDNAFQTGVISLVS